MLNLNIQDVPSEEAYNTTMCREIMDLNPGQSCRNLFPSQSTNEVILLGSWIFRRT